MIQNRKNWSAVYHRIETIPVMMPFFSEGSSQVTKMDFAETATAAALRTMPGTAKEYLH